MEAYGNPWKPMGNRWKLWETIGTMGNYGKPTETYEKYGNQ